MPPDLLITGGKDERLANNDPGYSDSVDFTISSVEERVMDWVVLIIGGLVFGFLIGELVRQWRKK